MLNDNQTLYDLLDIGPDASPQEIRDAYLRTKTTYNRDNLVLYTLVTPEEREESLKKIEEAYLVLSDPDKRRAYDQNYLQFEPSDNPFGGAPPSSEEQTGKIIPISRTPPMENVLNSENLLIPPKTDFDQKPQEARSMSMQQNTTQSQPSGEQIESDLPFLGISVPSGPNPGNPSSTDTVSSVPTGSNPAGPSGGLLRRIREGHQISLEEMSGITKVTKTYITAIEDENFAKLPASVFVRGFVVQIAKVLRLPHDKVATAYVARYHAKKPNSSS
ncbi:MAG: helix-turn-helix domain-containing protein [Bdellovibrio sp.]|nr:helix-turn-helix domain-containing protein [Bdellovibrio sp.]